MTRRRGGNGVRGGAPLADITVCLPHRSLMPKPIRNPSRPTDAQKRHPSRPINRCQEAPLFRTRCKHMGSSGVTSEPPSPKVTCAGQIKARPKCKSRPTCSKNWCTITEEIEKLHKQRNRPSWPQSLCLKKVDILHFLNALRGLRFSKRCLSSFHGSVDCTSNDGGREQEEEDDDEKEVDTVFSKWFMVLEENPGAGFKKEEEEGGDGSFEEEEPPNFVVPPSNALLLMRSCRSTTTQEKGFLKGNWEEAGGEGEDLREKKIKEEEKERLVLMSYAPDFLKLSSDIIKETWLVGSMDPLARCRNWKR